MKSIIEASESARNIELRSYSNLHIQATEVINPVDSGLIKTQSTFHK